MTPVHDGIVSSVRNTKPSALWQGKLQLPVNLEAIFRQLVTQWQMASQQHQQFAIELQL